MDNVDLDNPLEYYKYKFPNDSNSELVVKSLMVSAGNKYLKTDLHSIEELESKGCSRLELDILTLVEIDNIT